MHLILSAILVFLSTPPVFSGECPSGPSVFEVEVRSVYDGDTLTVDIALPFDVTLSGKRVRLAGIDAPEVRGGTEAERAAGAASRDWLRAQTSGDILLEVAKERDKYGRILGAVYRRTKGSCLHLNSEAVRLGYARAW